MVSRQPRGVPIGGQFAESSHDQPGAIVEPSTAVCASVSATRSESSTGPEYDKGFDAALRVLGKGVEDWQLARQISDGQHSLDGGGGPFGQEWTQGSIDAQARALSAMNNGGEIDPIRTRAILHAASFHEAPLVLASSR